MACEGSFHQYRYEEAPCDTCPLWEKCKREHIACPTFATWCLSGHAAQSFSNILGKKKFIDKPTYPIYRLVFSGYEKPPKEMVRDAAGSVENMGESK